MPSIWIYKTRITLFRSCLCFCWIICLIAELCIYPCILYWIRLLARLECGACWMPLECLLLSFVVHLLSAASRDFPLKPWHLHLKVWMRSLYRWSFWAVLALETRIDRFRLPLQICIRDILCIVAVVERLYSPLTRI